MCAFMKAEIKKAPFGALFIKQHVPVDIRLQLDKASSHGWF